MVSDWLALHFGPEAEDLCSNVQGLKTSVGASVA